MSRLCLGQNIKLSVNQPLMGSTVGRINSYTSTKLYLHFSSIPEIYILVL